MTDPRGSRLETSTTSWAARPRRSRPTSTARSPTPTTRRPSSPTTARDLLRTLTAHLTGGVADDRVRLRRRPGDGSTITSNDLLREIVHPDKTTGAASSTRAGTAASYNALGERITTTDRNGNVHTYSFDVLGRPTADAVTTLGTGVDGAVRRLETAYDTAGPAVTCSPATTRPPAATSSTRCSASSTAWASSLTEYQAHAGAVNTGTTPKVQYTYSEMAGGANHSRLTSMTYPNGFTVDYNYASGLDTTISRLTSLTNGSTHAGRLHLPGAGTGGHANAPAAGRGPDLHQAREPATPATSTPAWTASAGSWTSAGKRSATDTDRFKYGYDRNGNRLYRDERAQPQLRRAVPRQRGIQRLRQPQPADRLPPRHAHRHATATASPTR